MVNSTRRPGLCAFTATGPLPPTDEVDPENGRPNRDLELGRRLRRKCNLPRPTNSFAFADSFLDRKVQRYRRVPRRVGYAVAASGLRTLDILLSGPKGGSCSRSLGHDAPPRRRGLNERSPVAAASIGHLSVVSDADPRAKSRLGHGGEHLGRPVSTTSRSEIYCADL
jgi:hypothetical protein